MRVAAVRDLFRHLVWFPVLPARHRHVALPLGSAFFVCGLYAKGARVAYVAAQSSRNWLRGRAGLAGVLPLERADGPAVDWQHRTLERR
jgi:hypothetical protein